MLLTCLHRWDLTGKPSVPVQTYRHGASAVVAVLHVRNDLLALAGADGNITLWCVRISCSQLSHLDRVIEGQKTRRSRPALRQS